MPSGITLDSLNCRREGSYLILFLPRKQNR